MRVRTARVRETRPTCCGLPVAPALAAAWAKAMVSADGSMAGFADGAAPFIASSARSAAA